MLLLACASCLAPAFGQKAKKSPTVPPQTRLYYVAADQKLMMVPVKAAGTTLSADAPQPLFEMPPLNTPLGSGEFRYAVSADGKRFLVQASAMDAAQPPITVITNWQAGLKK